MTGKVYLVGAGPGDPGLITVKGMHALEQAQVVVYDRLVDPVLLQAVPQSAERIFVGKARGRQQLTQTEINQLLVDKASQGFTVVRLKGGDPFVFGRGGEEALELKANGLPFEIVPGVTSAIAGPAYAGIPLTHRGLATTFTVVSGSEDPSKPESVIPWEVLAKNGGTLVVLMGWASLEKILATLQKEGLPATTPAALVQWGTWSEQQTVTGNIDNILVKGQEARLTPPVITVIGGEGDANHGLDAYRGMGRRRPLLAGAFTVLLLGQAGIPFTGGFVVKLGVLASAVDNGSYLLAAVAMLAAAVAAFVYLRILVALYLEDDGSDGDGRAALPAAPAGPVFVSLVAAAGVLAVGLVPGPLLSLARDAVPVLVGG